ncbi:hypothetical protein PYW07_011138 [Mythimna separata]|uniref:Uncharacterized protein n=1 Tax=Mythimna separata TaxID=271217 RepID=A0AAD7Y7E7_MYTSE|nr:hypothetical protein PYW07_011138 [Mythimna separata]
MTSKSDLILYNEISDKIQIAVNVLSKSPCYWTPAAEKDLLKTMSYYTGVNQEYIKKALMRKKEKKTFIEWLRYKNSSNEPSFIEQIRKIEYEHMRRVIIDQYVNQLEIPTKISMIQAIKDNVLSLKEYTRAMLKQDLHNLGFIWKRLPKTDKYIVVENTEQFSRRMKYLHQMKEYRKNNRVLIHIERTIPCSYYISDHRVHSTEIIAVASPQLGLIDVYFPPKLQTLEFWLKNKMHTLPPNSVFVIEQSNPYANDLHPICKLPTMHSQKKEMIEWLNAYDIPYDPSAHRGEMFALIEKHKVYCQPSYRFGEILKAAGHDVIFRPPELTYIKYFKRVMRPIFSKSSMTLVAFKHFVMKKMNDVNPGYWLRQDQILAEHEQVIYDEDQKLELILDRLMDNTNNGRLTTADLIDCEVDELDNAFLNRVVFDAAPVKKSKTSIPDLWVNPETVDPKPSKAGPSGSVKPGPSGSGKRGPSGSVKPGRFIYVKSGPSESAKPGPSGSVKPGPSGSVKPGLSQSVKPGPSGSAKPGPSQSVKPDPLESAKLGPSESAKPDPLETTKLGPSVSAKPDPLETTKPGLSESAKPGPSQPRSGSLLFDLLTD